jgi:ArsR family transcriptional regulator
MSPTGCGQSRGPKGKQNGGVYNAAVFFGPGPGRGVSLKTSAIAYICEDVYNQAMDDPANFFGLLADFTRLRALMLMQAEGELCVCELTFALQESQPKVSRHLALLREAGVVEARRDGTWMHYRIHPDSPAWMRELIELTHRRFGNSEPCAGDLGRLDEMNNRPERVCA